MPAPIPDMIRTARQLTPKRALRAGVVDEVVHPAVLLRAAVDHATRDKKREPNGGATVVERAATHFAPARAFALRQARSRTLAETKGRYPAPLAAIEAVAIGLARGIDAGLDAEARAFGELAVGETARSLTALVVLTLHQRRAALEGLGKPRAITNLGVVGLGFMGSGIAQVAAASGVRVRARDRDAAAVAKGLSTIRELTTDAAKKGVFERREAARIVGRVTGGPDLAGFHSADLVIEAVFEEIATKRRVIAELEQVLRPEAVIASNTSALPIAEIAREARSPERIVGMHFFSPVHKMPLIEIVRPAAADANRSCCGPADSRWYRSSRRTPCASPWRGRLPGTAAARGRPSPGFWCGTAPGCCLVSRHSWCRTCPRSRWRRCRCLSQKSSSAPRRLPSRG